MSLCTVFLSVLSKIDEVLLIKPFANVFVFGDFNTHHDDWLAYSGGTDRSGGISNDFTQMVNFPTLIPECDSHSRALLDLFICSDASICSTIALLSLINSYYVAVSFSMNFPIASKQDDPIHRIAYDYSCAD